MSAAGWIINALGWPVLHLALGGIAVRLPNHLFADDTWLTAPRSWELDGMTYRRVLAIRKWKALLPDGAPWVGGIPKGGLLARKRVEVPRFIAETRRAEIAHWCMLGCLPLFWLWNPPWARIVMSVYAVAANLPCILAQRYNRIILLRLTRRFRPAPMLA